ncbi:MAG: glycosyltransferase [Paludibacteraceae bacterium]|nr:glycosyltransferase [Paludibacteraceae bacterium]
MNSPRILHISNFYSPHVGGIEDTCRTMVSIVKRNNVGLQKVICFSGSRSSYVGEVDGVTVQYVGGSIQVASQWISFRYFFALRKIIRQFQPDIIHFHSPNPLIAFYLLMLLPENVRLIVHWHADVVKQKRLYTFIKPIEKRLLEKADVILTTSPNYARDSKPLQPYLDKVEVLASVINENAVLMTEDIRRSALQIKRQYNNRPILFFIGRHVPYKGLERLVAAERFVKNDCVIVIAGEGPLTEMLKKKSEGRERVNFVGRISDDEKKAYYEACTIFVFPSVTKNEAFGLALAEAMYFAKPTITFHIHGSGVNWVSLNGETGIEVENGDVHAYAEAIDELLSDKEKRSQMGLAARKRVEENFLVNCIEQQVIQLYQRVKSKQYASGNS